MTQVTRNFAVIAFLILCLGLFILPGAGQGLAQAPGPTIDNCGDSTDGYYAVRITGCIKEILKATVGRILRGMEPFFLAVIGPIMVLALTLHGTKVAAGALEHPWRDTMMFFFKLGAVFIFTRDFAQMYDYPYDILDYLIYIVTTPIELNNDFGNLFGGIAANVLTGISNFGLGEFRCDTQFIASRMTPGYAGSFSLNADGSSPIPNEFYVWGRIDCMMMYIMGFALITSPIFLIVLIAAVFTGVGMALFWAGLSFLWFLLLSVLRAVVIYIMALLNITILIMIVPLIFPTMLFKSTIDIFTTWLKEMFDAIIQPVFIFTFIGFFIHMLSNSIASIIYYAYLLASPGPSTPRTQGEACSLNGAMKYVRSQDPNAAIPDPTATSIPDTYSGLSTGGFGEPPCLIDPDPNTLMSLFIEVLVALVLCQLMYTFYDHLRRLSARFVRIVGINYFNILDGLFSPGGASQRNQYLENMHRVMMRGGGAPKP